MVSWKRRLFTIVLAICMCFSVGFETKSEAGIFRGIGKAVVGAAKVATHPLGIKARRARRAARSCGR